MVLTNAERQRRFRERHGTLRATRARPDNVRSAEPQDGAAVLTAEQRAARDAVMSEPLYPVPSLRAPDPWGRVGIDYEAIKNLPRFMGWERYEWSAAPMELIEYFGMQSARAGWDAENAAIKAESDRVHAERNAYVARIIDECGDAARKILARGGGNSELTRAYEADPTLGVKPRKRKSVM